MALDEAVQEAVRWQAPWRDDPAWSLTVPRVERRLAQLLPSRMLTPPDGRDVLIVGPRRVGKTVVMQQTVRGLLRRGVPTDRISWLRLDHPELMRRSLGALVRHVVDEAAVTTAAPLYLFLEEVMRAQDWDLWLKTFRDDGWPVRVVATASATSTLLMRLRERHPRFAGRVWLTWPEAPHVRPQDAADGVGTIALDVLLRTAGAVADGALEPLLGISSASA